MTRRITLPEAIMPYVQDRAAEWGVDLTTALQTMILDHKRAGLAIVCPHTGAVEPMGERPAAGEPDNSEQVSQLLHLLDQGLQPSV
jgi:hypothetical protein